MNTPVPPEPINPAEDQPGTTPGATLAAVCAGLCFLLLVTVGAFAPLLNLAFGLWFTEIFVFFGVAWELLRLSGRDPDRYTGISHVSGLAIGMGGLFGLVNFFGVVAPLQLLAKTYLEPWVPLVLRQDLRRLFDSTSQTELWLVLAAIGLAAPVAEELAFRGVIQNSLSERGSPRRALLVTALLFSAFHLDVVGFPARFELGILFGMLFIATRSVWPGIAAHAANNLTSAALFLFSRFDRTTDSAAPPLLGVVTYGIGGMTVLVMCWRWLAPLLRRHAAPSTSFVLARRPSSLWPALGRWGGAAVLCLVVLWLAKGKPPFYAPTATPTVRNR